MEKLYSIQTVTKVDHAGVIYEPGVAYEVTKEVVDALGNDLLASVKEVKQSKKSEASKEAEKEKEKVENAAITNEDKSVKKK